MRRSEVDSEGITWEMAVLELFSVLEKVYYIRRPDLSHAIKD